MSTQPKIRIQWPTPSPPLPAGDPSGKDGHYVYHLICPVTHRVRYIGCTCSPSTRWRSHYGNRGRATREWVEWLVEQGLLPIMQIVAGPLPVDQAYSDEARRIVEAVEQGWDGLLNRKMVPPQSAPKRRSGPAPWQPEHGKESEDAGSENAPRIDRVSDTLRNAIAEDSRPLHRLADDAGVPRSTLQEWWVDYSRSIRLRHVDSLCEALGLVLVKR